MCMIEILWEKYLKRLKEVNDETKTEHEHNTIRTLFSGWKEGVKDANGTTFNGDYYYIDLFDRGEMKERPLCCGEFLDWKSEAL